MNEPDWNELRADNRVVWGDDERYGLAVYAGQGGEVVMAWVEGGVRSYHCIGPTEFATFDAAFKRAAAEAAAISRERDVAYDAHLAIEKARGQA